DHRDLVLGQPHVQPAQHVVASKRLVHLYERDRVGFLRGSDDARVEAVLLGPFIRTLQGLQGHPRRSWLVGLLRSVLLAHAHPPIGALAFPPQKTWVPNMPIRWIRIRLSTIDFAVARPTPTGPPLAL